MTSQNTFRPRCSEPSGLPMQRAEPPQTVEKPHGPLLVRSYLPASFHPWICVTRITCTA